MNATLTAREIDVVRLLAKGCTYGRVAQLLRISEHTVASHIKNVYRKLEVHSAPAAVMRAIQLRLLADLVNAPNTAVGTATSLTFALEETGAV